jgi:hypothetical protein
MRREELEKLLGGYAAGTLTEEEQRALLEAALTDQTLFDALAKEEPLRDALADPACREQVLAALETPAVRRTPNWWWRPQVWALAGGLAVACLIAVVAIETLHKPVAVVEIAQVPKGNVRPLPAPLAAPAEQVPAAKPREEAPAKRKETPEAARGRMLQAPPLVADEAKKELPAPPAMTSAVSSEPERSPVVAESRNVPSAPAPPAAKVAVAAPAPPPPPASTAAARLAGQPTQPELEAQPQLLREGTRAGAVGGGIGLAARRQDAKDLYYQGFGNTVSDAAQKQEPANRLEKLDQRTVRKQASAPAELGVRCSLLRRSEEGKFAEVPLDTPLAAGESARLRVEANQAGYLYVLAQHRALFSGPVTQGQPVVVPVQPGLVHVILARQKDEGPLSTVVRRTRAQQAAEAAQRTERDKAVYVVNVSSYAKARVLTDIQVNSR